MARYLNIYPQKNIVIQKAYDDDFSKWICEYEYIAAIETDEGCVVQVPVMYPDELVQTTADSFLKEYNDGEMRIMMPYDCPARDGIIKDSLTEWICNEGCVDGCGLAEAICRVVSLLTKSGMWKDEYAKCIDVKKIKEEWDEE
jgi:hypothetical protein